MLFSSIRLIRYFILAGSTSSFRLSPFSPVKKNLVNCEVPGHTRRLSAGKRRRENYDSLNLVHCCWVDRGGYREISDARAHDDFLDNRARHHRIDHRRRGYPHVFAPDNRTIPSRRPHFFHTWRDPGPLRLHQAEYPFSPRSLIRKEENCSRDQNTDLMNFIFTKNIGMLLLAIYLIVIGLSTIAALAISGVITGVLALAAGIFILIGR